MHESDIRKNSLVILLFCTVALSTVLHFSIFTKDIIGFHSWRQSWTQTNIHNFIFEDFNILNPRINNMNFTGDERIFRNEFPLYQWLIALIGKTVGYSISVSRIFNFLASILALIGMGLIIQTLLNNKREAFIVGFWSLCWAPVFYFYSVNILPDVLAFSLAVLSIGLLLLYFRTQAYKWFVLSCFVFGISVLQKLPYIIFIPSFALAVLLQKSKMKSTLYITLSLMPAIAWYAWVIPTWNNGVTKGLLNVNSYSSSELLGYFRFYLFDCFPKTFIGLFFIPFTVMGFLLFIQRKYFLQKIHLVFLSSLITTIAYFTFEINMLAYSHDYYLLAFLPFIIYYTSIGILWVFEKSKIAAILILTAMPVVAYSLKQEQWDKANAGFNYKIAEHSKAIQTVIPANDFCITGNDFSGHIYLYYLNRKGFTYTDNYLDSSWTKDYINRGATYLVADNSYIGTTERLIPFLDSLVYFKDDICVYRLKNNHKE